MKKENSYAELTKAYALANQQKEKFVQSIYIDTLIQESILKEQQYRIKQSIDTAIDHNDKESFFILVKELFEIEKQLNA